ncbi:MAG TPA: hypothetical protein VFT89_07240 [Rhizobiaceae bacterium]|nr:hypothetical protein [Rhizobiaceae bacterium]
MISDELIARVEALTGPDREVDAEIMFDLFAKPVGVKKDGGPMGYLWPEDNPSWSFGIRFPGKDRAWFKRSRRDRETLLIERDGALVLMNDLRVPTLTASLDAAVALVETALPGWTWRVATCSVSDDAWAIPDFNHPVHGERLLQDFGQVEGDPSSYWQDITDVDLRPSGRPAIALVLATLRALRAKEEG